jgi:hypothetical protein
MKACRVQRAQWSKYRPAYHIRSCRGLAHDPHRGKSSGRSSSISTTDESATEGALLGRLRKLNGRALVLAVRMSFSRTIGSGESESEPSSVSSSSISAAPLGPASGVSLSPASLALLSRYSRRRLLGRFAFFCGVPDTSDRVSLAEREVSGLSEKCPLLFCSQVRQRLGLAVSERLTYHSMLSLPK